MKDLIFRKRKYYINIITVFLSLIRSQKIKWLSEFKGEILFKQQIKCKKYNTHHSLQYRWTSLGMGIFYNWVPLCTSTTAFTFTIVTIVNSNIIRKLLNVNKDKALLDNIILKTGQIVLALLFLTRINIHISNVLNDNDTVKYLVENQLHDNNVTTCWNLASFFVTRSGLIQTIYNLNIHS